MPNSSYAKGESWSTGFTWSAQISRGLSKATSPISALLFSKPADQSLRAFSTLVADSQFSTLGVVLLAILARVGRLVGLPEPLAAPVLKPGQIAKVVLATSLKETGDDRGELVPRVYGSEDVGEVISREVAEKMSKGEDRDLGKVVDGQLDDVGDAAVSHESRKEARRHEVAEADLAIGMERKKKRRKKGNAIDDLFAGL